MECHVRFRIGGALTVALPALALSALAQAARTAGAGVGPQSLDLQTRWVRRLGHVIAANGPGLAGCPCCFLGQVYASPVGPLSVTWGVKPRECQLQCENISGCEFWTSTLRQNGTECLAFPGGGYFEDGPSTYASGPRVCPPEPSGCSEVPGPQWPGATAGDTAAAWPHLREPKIAECWPGVESPAHPAFHAYPTCQKVTVLEDMATGFAPECHSLEPVDSYDRWSCESHCRAHPECSVWAVDEGSGACYMSYLDSSSRAEPAGSSLPPCEVDASGITRAQRLLHGEVRVLKSLQHLMWSGMQSAFLADGEVNSTSLCRILCYGNVGCRAWVYSSTGGCRVESLDAPLVVPPSSELVYEDMSVIDGEYIQHMCPVAMQGAPSGTSLDDGPLGPAASRDSAATDFGGTPRNPHWAYVACAFLAVLVSCGAFVAGLQCFRKRRPRRQFEEYSDTENDAE